MTDRVTGQTDGKTRPVRGTPLLIWVMLFIMGINWGLGISIVKIISESGIGYPAAGFAAALGSAVILGGFASVRAGLPKGADLWKSLAIFGLVCSILSLIAPFFLQVWIAKYLPAGLIALMVAMAPLMTYGFAAMVGMEPVTRRGLLGVVIGFGAALIVLLPDAALPEGTLLIYVLLALGIPLMDGLYHIIATKLWPDGAHTLQVGAAEAVMATVLLLPVAIWFGGFDAFFVQDWGKGHWAVVIIILMTAFDAWIYFDVIRRAGPVLTAQTNYIALITGILWGMLIFGEQPSLWFWSAVAVLILALIVMPRLEEEAPEPEIE